MVEVKTQEDVDLEDSDGDGVPDDEDEDDDNDGIPDEGKMNKIDLKLLMNKTPLLQRMMMTMVMGFLMLMKMMENFD